MNLKQKLYDLQQKLLEQSAISKKFVEDDDMGEDFRKSEQKCEELNGQIAQLKALIAREDGFEQPAGSELEKGMKGAGQDPVYTSGTLKGLKKSAVKEFAAGVRKAMNEGTGSAGGYTVPEDIVTRVYELIESKRSLRDLMRNENVTTNTGRRTYKVRAAATGFTVVSEGAAFPVKDGPTFGVVNYAIKKRGNLILVTNELLEDSDENIAARVIEAMADDARKTYNTNGFALLEAQDATEITSIDTLLAAYMTGLDAAMRAGSSLITNSNGVMWLYSQKDGNGRSLLQPNPSVPGQMQLSVGPVTIPIDEWPVSDLPNEGEDEDVIPFIGGNIFEALFHFDRRELTVARSSEATIVDGGTTINLFQQDMTAFRGYIRDDYQVRDAAAWLHMTFTPDP